ncbi:MAG TPA: GNAT family N-acetyltransferase [Tepidisphaeraceae bacterium]|jgi:phosphinothricin acetyltransferase
MPDTVIRPAAAADLPAINAIYNHYVSYCTSTLQDEPDSAAERAAWYAGHDTRHPVTVAVGGDEVVGFAALSAFHPRAGFAGCAQDTLFVKHTAQGRGIGSSLMKDLLIRAAAVGHHTVIALIAADQGGMLRLRESNGYVEAGRLAAAAVKFGRRLDVAVMQKTL